MKSNLPYYFLLFLSFCFYEGLAQSENELSIVTGKVVNAKDDQPLEKVNIVNLNQVKGTTTLPDGTFEIQAKVNDTLFFSNLGFATINIKVSEDWLKYGNVTIAMTESAVALEEVVIDDIELTGYLEIDARRAPIYSTRRYSINGLNTGYEAGDEEPGAVNKVLGSIFNPADFLFNTFGKKGKDLRKLRQIKKEDEIRNLLKSKYDRETLMNLLQMDRVDIDEILRNCQYSKTFIEEANDLQILDAISECYEEYKVLKNTKKN
jgi:hypothetical protein